MDPQSCPIDVQASRCSDASYWQTLGMRRDLVGPIFGLDAKAKGDEVAQRYIQARGTCKGPQYQPCLGYAGAALALGAVPIPQDLRNKIIQLSIEEHKATEELKRIVSQKNKAVQEERNIGYATMKLRDAFNEGLEPGSLSREEWLERVALPSSANQVEIGRTFNTVLTRISSLDERDYVADLRDYLMESSPLG